MSAFDDLMGDPEPDYDIPAPELDALEDADRHLRALRRIASRQAELDRVFTAEITRIQNVYQRRSEVLAAQREWHELPLEQLHARLLGADPKRKTIILPNGTLKARKGPDTIEYEDEAAFIEWAERVERDGWLSYKVSPAKNAVRQATSGKDGAVVTADGEIVPGLRHVPGEVRFTVAEDTE